MAGLFYFIRQRRRGAREARAAAAHELGGLDAKYEPYSSSYAGEKDFAADMGPRPDNSWPDEGGEGSHAAPLLGAGPQSPRLDGGFGGEAYEAPQSPPPTASVAPHGYESLRSR